MRRSGWSRSCRAPRATGSALPDMMFVRPTVVLIFDRLADQLFLVAPLWPDSGLTPERAVALAEERIDARRRAAGERRHARRHRAPICPNPR